MRRLGAALLAALMPLAAGAQAPTTPSETVDAFHKAMRVGDGKAALAFMARDVNIYEQGYVETTREQYAANQLADANRFAKLTERRVMRRESGQDERSAWVLSTTLTTGEFEHRKIELEGTETMLLRREGEAWVIAHIHWSAHPRSADDSGASP